MDSGHQGGKAESCREQVMAAAERRWLFQQWWGADCGQDVIKNHSCTGGKTGRSGLPLGMQQARERFYLMYFTPEFCIGFNWEILCSEFCYDLPNWKSLWGFLGCWFLGKKKRHRPELWPAQPCPPSLWWSGATLCSQQEESWQGTDKAPSWDLHHVLSTEGHPTHVQPNPSLLDPEGGIFAVRQVWNQADGMVHVLCGSPICVLCPPRRVCHQRQLCVQGPGMLK